MLKPGYITLRALLGVEEKTSAYIGLLLIIDGSNYLFIHLSSRLLSSVSLVCNLNWKRGQFGGKGDDARSGFSLDGGMKRKGLWEPLLYAVYGQGATTAGGGCLDGDPRYERMWLGEDGYGGMREPQWGQEVAAVINSVSCVTLGCFWNLKLSASCQG